MSASLPPVIVIGAGLGGLAAAISLASRGVPVEIFEALERPGGKAGIVSVEGVEVDTGPSVLTMVPVFEALFEAAGSSLAENVELMEGRPAFRYLWDTGRKLDVHADPAWTRASIAKTLGADAAAELDAFLAYAGRIWEAAAPAFVFGPAPTPGNLLRLSWGELRAFRHIDPFSRMEAGIRRHVRDPHLQDVLLRYATYNGSDPRRAPATLNCIAHVELVEGGFGVRGGIHALIGALAEAAAGLGVRIHCGAPVEAIEAEAGRVSGVRVGGKSHAARAVIANADAAQVRDSLLAPLGAAAQGSVGKERPPSMSGWTGIVRARRREAERRPAHTVLFGTPYLQEFEDIFDAHRPPREPTVYVCAQEKAHGRSGWAEEEPLFVMINAPALGEGGFDGRCDAARDRALARLVEAGLIEVEDRLVWERHPADLARLFPGSRGSIYGAASNSPLAAFHRPANRMKRPQGLYLASGSAHPGGGMPLCARSGVQAAEELLAELAKEERR